MRKVFLLLSVLVLSLASSCKSEYELMLHSNDVTAKYKMAFELYEAEKYSKAASMFESLKIAVRGTLQDDTVHYYTACSHYRFGDMMAAEQAFNVHVATFPQSPFVYDSRFKYLDCLYRQTYRYELDQTPTFKAIDAIKIFMLDYPDTEHMERCKEMMADLDERLDRKDYEAARLYYKIEDYQAAHYALKLLLKEDPNSLYREDVMYYAVMSAYKYAWNSVSSKQQDRYMVFKDEYFSFVSEYPESDYRKELDHLAKKVQNILEK